MPALLLSFHRHRYEHADEHEREDKQSGKGETAHCSPPSLSAHSIAPPGAKGYGRWEKGSSWRVCQAARLGRLHGAQNLRPSTPAGRRLQVHRSGTSGSSGRWPLPAETRSGRSPSVLRYAWLWVSPSRTKPFQLASAFAPALSALGVCHAFFYAARRGKVVTTLAAPVGGASFAFLAASRANTSSYKDR